MRSPVRSYFCQRTDQEDRLLQRKLLDSTLDNARAESDDTCHLNGSAERHLHIYETNARLNIETGPTSPYNPLNQQIAHSVMY